jgi:hypothetical protein
MTDKKISQLTAATTPLAGTEVLPIVQSGSTVKVAISDVTAGRSVATGPLTSTVGDNGAISITQNGANQTGYINFVDSDAGLAGRIKYDHSNNSLQFFSNSVEQVRLESSGTFIVKNGGVTVTAGDFLLDTNGKSFIGNSGAARMTFNSGETAINETGANLDFRIEGDVEQNLVFVDASADQVGFGTSTPDQRVTIQSGGIGFNRFNTTITPANDSKGLIYVRQNGNSAGNAEEMRYLAVNHGFYSNAGARIATFDSNSNLKIETAAKGIDFSANTGAAGETSSLLDWYEEGTWTPIYDGLTSSPTVSYASQTEGKYTRIGNIVYVSAALRTASVSGGSGSVVVGGLPFTVASAGTGEAENSSFSIGFASAFDTVFPNAAYAAAGTTYIRLRVSSSSAATTSLDVANLQTGANQNYLYLSGFYFVA